MITDMLFAVLVDAMHSDKSCCQLNRTERVDEFIQRTEALQALPEIRSLGYLVCYTGGVCPKLVLREDELAFGDDGRWQMDQGDHIFQDCLKI